MARIIKDTSKESVPLWSRKIECDACKSVYLADESDISYVPPSYGDSYTLGIGCPVCGEMSYEKNIHYAVVCRYEARKAKENVKDDIKTDTPDSVS